MDADLKAIYQIEFIGHLKTPHNAIIANESHVWFNDSRKNRRNKIKFLSKKFNSLINDAELWRSKS